MNVVFPVGGLAGVVVVVVMLGGSAVDAVVVAPLGGVGDGRCSVGRVGC